ncbi:MAG: hypothetical protein MUF15_22605 [Acidobacteria bacterium]|jgi:radical SAM protein with 4Fe4S-binding SPASM domain|nr:hypothetical protein [Acidobacteriota bacterium]
MNEKIQTITQRVKKFHQFVHVEKGPVNAAIIDLLKGNVFQVKKDIIEKMEKGAVDEIPDFMEAAANEGLIIEVKPNTWIPGIPLDSPFSDDEEKEEDMNLEVQVEEGVNLKAVLQKFSGPALRKVVYYGTQFPKIQFDLENIKCVFKEKDFQECEKTVLVAEDFNQITHTSYQFNRHFNSCWGRKIAVTSDGKIRPCIYSDICVADLDTVTIERLPEIMNKYWTFTKDKVKTCRDCELRHICFDCREIARREGGGDLEAPNRHCRYNPYNGTWD